MVRKTREDEEPFDIGATAGLGGILGGLGGLVKKLADLAETAEEVSKSGELGSGGQRDVKGVYGFSVKVGLGGEGVQVQPFGTVRQERQERAAGQATVVEIREPMVDVFEEAEYLLIVAEMPGIGAEDVHLDLQEDILVLSAAKGDKKYRKEVLLPSSFLREKMTISCNNGVVEIKCPK